LPDDPTALQSIVFAAQAEIERRRLIIAGLRRNRFGRRSERLDDKTLPRGVEDLEQSLGEHAAGLEAAASPPEGSKPEPPEPESPAAETPPRRPRTEPAKRNRGALPAHLARHAVVIDVEDKTCPCCNGTRHRIGPRSGPMPRQAVSWLGEDVSEMLDCVPAHVRVRVIRRPKYGWRACGEAAVQAPAPERPSRLTALRGISPLRGLIDGGLATEALLAHVLVSKYADRLPLYRQSQIFARQGIALDRSTLCNWVGRACWWLAPLHELLLSTVLASPRVFARACPRA
jgi:transposase